MTFALSTWYWIMFFNVKSHLQGGKTSALSILALQNPHPVHPLLHACRQSSCFVRELLLTLIKLDYLVYISDPPASTSDLRHEQAPNDFYGYGTHHLT